MNCTINDTWLVLQSSDLVEMLPCDLTILDLAPLIGQRSKSRGQHRGLFMCDIGAYCMCMLIAWSTLLAWPFWHQEIKGKGHKASQNWCTEYAMDRWLYDLQPWWK